MHKNDDKVKVERREDLIASQAFFDLWAKVSVRTRYKRELIDADLVAKAVDYLQQMPDLAVARVT